MIATTLENQADEALLVEHYRRWGISSLRLRNAGLLEDEPNSVVFLFQDGKKDFVIKDLLGVVRFVGGVGKKVWVNVRIVR